MLSGTFLQHGKGGKKIDEHNEKTEHIVTPRVKNVDDKVPMDVADEDWDGHLFQMTSPYINSSLFFKDCFEMVWMIWTFVAGVQFSLRLFRNLDSPGRDLQSFVARAGFSQAGGGEQGAQRPFFQRQ